MCRWGSATGNGFGWPDVGGPGQVADRRAISTCTSACARTDCSAAVAMTSRSRSRLAWTRLPRGTTVKLPTLEGKRVTVKVPPGSQPGRVVSLTGQGVPGRSGQPAGDLLVTLRVVVPEHLSEEQQRAFEALANVCPSPSRAHLGV